jgi:uncharacterized membrane protein YphA (DoxX/SURF4 family)
VSTTDLNADSRASGVNGETPSLLKRVDRSGVPLMVARVVLGLVFIWMGLAKTGMPRLVLNETGWIETSTAQSLVESGWIELSGPVEFLKLIREYEMIPDQAWGLLNVAAVAVPWVEVLCGLLLIFGVAVRGSALLLLLLLIGFTVMIALRAIRIFNAADIPFCSIKFDCGCGAGEVYACYKLPENLGLILLAVLALVSQSNRFCLRKRLFARQSLA